MTERVRITHPAARMANAIGGIMIGTPEFAQHLEHYPEGTVAYPHLYQKSAV